MKIRKNDKISRNQCIKDLQMRHEDWQFSLFSGVLLLSLSFFIQNMHYNLFSFFKVLLTVRIYERFW